MVGYTRCPYCGHPEVERSAAVCPICGGELSHKLEQSVDVALVASVTRMHRLS